MTGPGASLEAGADPAEPFSVREFARTAVGSYRDRIDVAAFAASPVDEDVARRLLYLADIERATMLYLRRVLVTPTHKDARITGFLTTWAFEKYWIADALTLAARAGHADLGPLEPDSDAAHALHEVGSRLSPVTRAIATNLIGPDVIAGHMATASVDASVLEAAYRQLARDADSEALTSLIELVLATKSRHRPFLEAETNERLAATRRARVLARAILPRVALPIGSDDEPRESARVFWSAFDERVLHELDAAAAAFPGLAGTRLATRAASRATRGSLARRVGHRLGQLVRSAGGRS